MAPYAFCNLFCLPFSGPDVISRYSRLSVKRRNISFRDLYNPPAKVFGTQNKTYSFSHFSTYLIEQIFSKQEQMVVTKPKINS